MHMYLYKYETMCLNLQSKHNTV